jgi:ferric-dicitrate binding protein FerR (iron transport regulator)
MEQSVVVTFGKYLAGEMNAAEKEAFITSMEADQQLKAEFMAYQRVWSQSTLPDVIWYTTASWNRFTDNQVTESPSARTYRLRLGWTIAASFLVVLTATWFLFLQPDTETHRYAVDGNNAIELKDGSVIHLNRSSAITVHPFTGKKRKVELSGEAYFEIAPDAQRPFMIECGPTVTEVVGTSFDIRQSGDEVLLSVQTGKVIFRATDAPKDEALALTTGEAAVFKGDQLRMLPNPSPNVSAWHSRQLWFNDMSYRDVFAECASYFNETIRLESDAIKDCTFTNKLPFKDPEIKSLLAAITQTVNAEIVMDGNVYVIKGGSCPQ